MRLVHFVVNIPQKMCLNLTFESVETQLWVTLAVRQRIPSRRVRNSKTPTTETIQSVARYDQLALSGRAQMLPTSDVCCQRPTVHQVRRSSSMESLIHEHCELTPYSIGDIEPVELIMQ